MRKVIIVDDEKWIRRGLIQSIPWDQLGLELAGEAKDGQEAYEMALEKMPDILFLDMRMPGLDGKQLIGMLNRDLPDLLTIVVSGYSDFEYTKEAIRHKAFEYLLKPVKKEELASVLEKAVAELDRREAERRKVTRESGENWLRQLLYHVEDYADPSAIQERDLLPTAWRSGDCAVMVGQPDAYVVQGEFSEFVDVLRLQLERTRPFLFGGQWHYEITFGGDSLREIVVAINGARLEHADLLRFSAIIQTVIKELGSPSFSLGFSTKGPLNVRKAYLEAKQVMNSKALGVAGAALFAGESVSHPPVPYPQERENAFLLALQAGSCEVTGQEFERLFLAFAADSMPVEHMQRSAILLIHSIEKLLQAKDIRFEEACGKKSQVYTEMIQHRNDAGSVKRLFTEELVPSLLIFYNHTGEKQGEKIVGEMKRLIETHYDQQLSLHQIAGSYYMNPDYLSRLFKKLTSTNFVDYLTDTRIQSAKELMKLSKYKNYEIAQMVGYEDYRYFSQIFKKKMGMTIGEYRLTLTASPVGQ